MGNFPIKPSITGVSKLIYKLDQNPRMVATFLVDILNGESPPHRSIDLQVFSILQEFCHYPKTNVIPPLIEEVIDLLDTNAESAYLYTILGCIFYCYRRPLLAMEYANYAQALGGEHSLLTKLLQRLPQSRWPSKPFSPVKKSPGLMPNL